MMRPQLLTQNMLLFNNFRTFFTLQRSHQQLLMRREAPLTQVATMDFSLKMRKVRAKMARVKKYKLKTKKAF